MGQLGSRSHKCAVNRSSLILKCLAYQSNLLHKFTNFYGFFFMMPYSPSSMKRDISKQRRENPPQWKCLRQGFSTTKQCEELFDLSKEEVLIK